MHGFDYTGNVTCRKIADLVRNCDLLVHEATIGPIPADVVQKEGLIHSCMCMVSFTW